LAGLPLADHWIALARQGNLYILATTVFHVGVVMAQVGNALTCRTETEKVHRLGWFSNRFLLFGIMIEVLLIVWINTFPPLGNLFGHVPLTLTYWLALSLYAPILYGLDRIRKSLARHLPDFFQQRKGGS